MFVSHSPVLGEREWHLGDALAHYQRVNHKGSSRMLKVGRA